MTTIDRAGLADDLVAASEMLCDITRTNANERFAMAYRLAYHRAALRQPDQKGEARDEPVAWTFDRPDQPYKFFTTDPNADNLDRSKLIPLYTRPAPEAGKLPSEEIDKVIRTGMFRFQDAGRMPAGDERFREKSAVIGETVRAVLALLSPAQPHDVPAWEDGLRGRLRDVALGGYRTDETGHNALHLEAADALEAQGRRIAELEAQTLEEAAQRCEWFARQNSDAPGAFSEGRASAGIALAAHIREMTTRASRATSGRA